MKFYTIKEEFLPLWTNDPSVTTETIIDSDEVHRLAREWDMDEDELIDEQLIEVYHPWYAVEMNEEDNDWGTGSYDYKEAVAMAERMEARYIAVIDLSGGDGGVCDKVIDLQENRED